MCGGCGECDRCVCTLESANGRTKGRFARVAVASLNPSRRPSITLRDHTNACGVGRPRKGVVCNPRAVNTWTRFMGGRGCAAKRSSSVAHSPSGTTASSNPKISSIVALCALRPLSYTTSVPSTILVSGRLPFTHVPRVLASGRGRGWLGKHAVHSVRVQLCRDPDPFHQDLSLFRLGPRQ